MKHVSITPELYARLTESAPIAQARFVVIRSDGLVRVFLPDTTAEEQVEPELYEAALREATRAGA